jgi:hypothetical protein
VSRAALAGALAYGAAIVAGSVTDLPGRTPPTGPSVIAGDFHVHAAPGDGLLPVWEVQREADRRGLDVIAITNHNHALAQRLARWSGRVAPYPIVIPSQELTTARYHMAAVGVTTMIDSSLSVRDAVAAIHAQGGVAIVSHPTRTSYRDPDVEGLRALDGAEAAHPLILFSRNGDAELREFWASARAVNPDLAAIGSSDFHGGPMGVCRTYLMVDDVTVDGVLDAIRRGRTVAAGPGDRLIGGDDDLNRVRPLLAPPQAPGFGRGPATWIALVALGAIALVVARTGRDT